MIPQQSSNFLVRPDQFQTRNVGNSLQNLPEHANYALPNTIRWGNTPTFSISQTPFRSISEIVKLRREQTLDSTQNNNNVQINPQTNSQLDNPTKINASSTPKRKPKYKPSKPEYAEPQIDSVLCIERNLFRLISRFITNLKGHSSYKVLKKDVIQTSSPPKRSLRDIKISLCKNQFFTNNKPLSDLDIATVLSEIRNDIDQTLKNIYLEGFRSVWKLLYDHFQFSWRILEFDEIPKLRKPKIRIGTPSYRATMTHNHNFFRGHIPISSDYHTVVERHPENGTFTLYDATTNEIILRVMYFNQQQFSIASLMPPLFSMYPTMASSIPLPQQPGNIEPSFKEPLSRPILTELYQFGEKIDSTYSKGGRGAATGNTHAPTYTFGYSRRYDGDRDYRDPVFPAKSTKSPRKPRTLTKPVLGQPANEPLRPISEIPTKTRGRPKRKDSTIAPIFVDLTPIQDNQPAIRTVHPEPMEPALNISSPVWLSPRPKMPQPPRETLTLAPLQLPLEESQQVEKLPVANSHEIGKNPFHKIDQDWKQLSRAGELMWQQISQKSPDLAKKMIELPYTIELQKRNLLVKNTAFTGITYNVSFETNYHKDLNDNPNFWAACLCLWKNGCYPSHTDEGMIVLPEYGIGIQIGHGDLYLIQSRNVMHGVVPAHPSHKRISVIGWQHNYLVGQPERKRRVEEDKENNSSLNSQEFSRKKRKVQSKQSNSTAPLPLSTSMVPRLKPLPKDPPAPTDWFVDYNPLNVPLSASSPVSSPRKPKQQRISLPRLISSPKPWTYRRKNPSPIEIGPTPKNSPKKMMPSRPNFESYSPWYISFDPLVFLQSIQPLISTPAFELVPIVQPQSVAEEATLVPPSTESKPDSEGVVPDSPLPEEKDINLLPTLSEQTQSDGTHETQPEVNLDQDIPTSPQRPIETENVQDEELSDTTPRSSPNKWAKNRKVRISSRIPSQPSQRSDTIASLWDEFVSNETIQNDIPSSYDILRRYGSLYYEGTAFKVLLDNLQNKKFLSKVAKVKIVPQQRIPNDYQSFFQDLGLISDPNGTAHYNLWLVRNYKAWLRDIKDTLQKLTQQQE